MICLHTSPKVSQSSWKWFKSEIIDSKETSVVFHLNQVTTRNTFGNNSHSSEKNNSLSVFDKRMKAIGQILSYVVRRSGFVNNAMQIKLLSSLSHYNFV